MPKTPQHDGGTEGVGRHQSAATAGDGQFPVVVLVGTGGIGSRHLQGLARMSAPARVVAVDPSDEARRVAADRWREIAGHDRHELILASAIDEVPRQIDVGIVATPSGPRLSALSGLLEGRSVSDVVLEKFLFPSLPEYAEAQRLLARARARAWVNTPRRLWTGYHRIAEILGPLRPIELRVTANARNGIGTTAVHFLDALAYLSGEHMFTADGSQLVASPEASRRDGYVDYTGTLEARSLGGDRLGYRAYATGSMPVFVDVSNPAAKILVDESRSTMRWCSADNGFAWREEPFGTALQSELTGDIAEALVEHGSCALPTFEESRRIHTTLLEAFLGAEELTTGERPQRVAVT